MDASVYTDRVATELSTKADDIARILEDEIVAGQIPPGTVLRQEQLSERFEVSRTPVREALRRLSALGLVSFEPNRGVRVRSISPLELREAFLVEGHRRIPVYRDSIDEIRGYVSWRDVLEQLWDGQPVEIAKILRALSARNVAYVAIGDGDQTLDSYDAVLDLSAGGRWRWSPRCC